MQNNAERTIEINRRAKEAAQQAESHEDFFKVLHQDPESELVAHQDFNNAVQRLANASGSNIFRLMQVCEVFNFAGITDQSFLELPGDKLHTFVQNLSALLDQEPSHLPSAMNIKYVDNAMRETRMRMRLLEDPDLQPLTPEKFQEDNSTVRNLYIQEDEDVQNFIFRCIQKLITTDEDNWTYLELWTGD